MDLQLWSHSRPPNAPPSHHLPDHNEKLLTRENLLDILADFSCRVLQLFQRPIRLVIHGGAVMLLHPGLYAQPGSRRRATRDVDYIHRSFVEEWRQVGMHDAEARLQSCINATAHRFQLGTDWMNAHADVALPMAQDANGRPYDPIYTSSLKPNNIHLHTVYTSAGLTLVSVTPFWAVALKMVRYQKDDPADITAILRNGTRLNGVQWSPEVLEQWLLTECWAMGYASYPSWLIHDMREKIGHAVRQLNAPPAPDQSLPRQSSTDLVTMPVPQQLVPRHPQMDLGPPHAAQHPIPPHRSRTPPPAHPVIPTGTSHHRMPVRHHHSLELLHPTHHHHHPHARSISRHQSLPQFDPSVHMPHQQPFPQPPMPAPQHPPMPMPMPGPAQQHTPTPPPGHPHRAPQMARPHTLLMPSQHRSPAPHHTSPQPQPQPHRPPAAHAAAPQHLPPQQPRGPVAMPVVPPGSMGSAMPVIPTAQLRGLRHPPAHGRISAPPQHGDEFQRHGGMLNWMPHTIMVGN